MAVSSPAGLKDPKSMSLLAVESQYNLGQTAKKSRCFFFYFLQANPLMFFFSPREIQEKDFAPGSSVVEEGRRPLTLVSASRTLSIGSM